MEGRGRSCFTSPVLVLAPYGLWVHQAFSLHDWSFFSNLLPCSECHQNLLQLSPFGCTVALCSCQPCTLEKSVFVIFPAASLPLTSAVGHPCRGCISTSTLFPPCASLPEFPLLSVASSPRLVFKPKEVFYPVTNLAQPGMSANVMASEEDPISCPVRGGDTRNDLVCEEQPAKRRKGNPRWH